MYTRLVEVHSVLVMWVNWQSAKASLFLKPCLSEFWMTEWISSPTAWATCDDCTGSRVWSVRVRSAAVVFDLSNKATRQNEVE